MSAEDVRDGGDDIFDMVSDADVQSHLHDLHLPGVIERHSVSPDESGKRLAGGRLAMLRGEFLGYFVRSQVVGEVGRIVGMATIQPDLTLHQQRWPLPRKVAETIRWGRSEVDRSDIGANTATWVDPRHEQHRDMVTDVYRIIQDEAHSRPSLQGKNLWTLVPKAIVDNEYYGGLLEATGFDNEGVGYYDDQEAHDGDKLPKSVLYVAHTAIWHADQNAT
jgi:hypothetical protein